MKFVYFKSVAGITIVLALMIAFINLLSIENAEIQIMEMVKAGQAIKK